jgi:uncharacterized membrane protein
MNLELTFFGLLALATLTTSLVTGLVFTFALLVMPGLGRLEDRAFLAGFQHIDAIIQRSHPVFVAVWLGSILSLVGAAFLGFALLEGLPRFLLLGAAALYLLAVQAPTFLGNLPLNNRLHRIDLAHLSPQKVAQERARFENRWNRLNRLRTVAALAVCVLLIGIWATT